MDTSEKTSCGRGPIFVSGADSDKAMSIVQQLLHLREKHRHLQRSPVYAGLPDASTARAKALETMGANIVTFDIFHEPHRAREALQGIAKLCLVIDPLSERMQQNDAVQYGTAFIDAAKHAGVDHVIFLTPFSPADPTPLSDAQPGSYRAQFMLIESHLRSAFDHNRVTILRYPGMVHQHLTVFRKYIAEHNAFPLPHLETTVELSDMVDIARAAACVAHAPTQRFSGNSYKITGPNLLTFQEVSERVQRGLQRDIAVKHMDTDTLKQIMCDGIGNEDRAAFLLDMWGLQQRLGRFEVTRDLEILTGQRGKTLNEHFQDDAVRNHYLSVA